MRRVLLSALLGFAGCAALAAPASARELRTGGKLLLTNGVTSIEGAAGGGLASWAVIGGNETDAGIGAKANVTVVPLADYRLVSEGAGVGLFDRVELSYQRQRFDTRAAGAKLGLGRGFTFGQDVIGAKLKIAGDAVYAQDSLLPQIAIGVQVKHANQSAVIHAVGGRHANGTDFYVAATKVVLSRSVLLNATLRLTKANQTGLLGFGGDRNDKYRAKFEGSAGYMLSRRFVVGAEYRSRPDNLGFAREDGAYDLFAAYALTHNLSLTAAYVDLGSIATLKGQRGAFLSLQASL